MTTYQNDNFNPWDAQAHNQAAQNIAAAGQRPSGAYSVHFPQGSNSNFTPVQPQQWTYSGQAAPQPQMSQQPNTYYAGQGTEALRALKAKCEGLWLGWVAYKASVNYYNMHADVADAAIHGAHALRRWWVWLFFTKVWLGTLIFIAWTTYLKYHTIDGEHAPNVNGELDAMRLRLLMWIIPATLAVFVMYTRNIDFALFKRRAFYWLVRPLAKVTTWVPNWILYLTVTLPFIFPWPMS